MSLIETGRKIIQSAEQWKQRRNLSSLCGDNLVEMRVFDVEDDNRGRKINIYDGSSDGYKQDFNVDKGQRILEELSGIKDGVRVDLEIRPLNNDGTNFKVVTLRK